MIRVVIPGEPCAQGRPRAAVVNGHASVFDPAKSRSWKGAARYEMSIAVASWYRTTDSMMRADDVFSLPFDRGPIAVTIRAFHACPRGDHRKSAPAPARWRCKKPDAENIAKAVLDAATGVLWADDAQVARLVVEQVTARQGEAPRVELEAEALPAEYSVAERAEVA